MVAKAYPDEKVGVFASRGGHIEVVEYSEMDPQEAASTDPGKLASMRLLAALRRALHADQVYLMRSGWSMRQIRHCPTPTSCLNRDSQASFILLHALLQMPVCISHRHHDLPAETGLLRFNWGNICMHYFTVPFLVRMAQQLQQQGCYHIAHKTIQSKDGPVKVGSEGASPIRVPSSWLPHMYKSTSMQSLFEASRFSLGCGADEARFAVC